ncbi:preprotein translocase subunit TatD [Spirochaetia bacterium]|nr:preprotein translocase subunit TatD [Spirochaetia bacterium]GHV54388.1 preprotein translocase subunit TatD [Spirochaetia bacterium]
MSLIDIGINLMNSAFDADRDEVVRSAEAAGVSPLIITGSSAESSRLAQEFAAAINTTGALHSGKLFSTAGVHPHNAKDWDAGTEALLRSLALHSEVAAIGECGLDYNRDFSPRDKQRFCFEAQIALAAEMKAPLFLHERDAFDDFSAILQNNLTNIKKMVVHCFTGGEKELERYLELGAYIGITGWICDERRGRHLISLIKKIPADKLLLETDAPYLMPRNMPGAKRNGRNESRHLVHIAEFIAEILGKAPAELAAETFTNACRFFDMKKI